jgi:hypothetical protein
MTILNIRMEVFMNDSDRNEVGNLIGEVSWKNRDIFCLFYLLVLVTFIIMVVQYNAYFQGIVIQFTLENFAKTLNVGITLIGTAEGIRSFTKSSTQKVGESSPVPPYKLRYLLSYIISFMVLTAVAIFFHIKVNEVEILDKYTQEVVQRPDFAYDQMTFGLLSNFVCYLIARYGDKLSENIDLSELTFFKKR